MTRPQQTRRRAERLEQTATTRAARAIRFQNPIGRGAIRAGQAASELWQLARNLFQTAGDQAAAAEREATAKRKKPKR